MHASCTSFTKFSSNIYCFSATVNGIFSNLLFFAACGKATDQCLCIELFSLQSPLWTLQLSTLPSAAFLSALNIELPIPQFALGLCVQEWTVLWQATWKYQPSSPSSS